MLFEPDIVDEADVPEGGHGEAREPGGVEMEDGTREWKFEPEMTEDEWRADWDKWVTWARMRLKGQIMERHGLDAQEVDALFKLDALTIEREVMEKYGSLEAWAKAMRGKAV